MPSLASTVKNFHGKDSRHKLVDSEGRRGEPFNSLFGSMVLSRTNLQAPDSSSFRSRTGGMQFNPSRRASSTSLEMLTEYCLKQLFTGTRLQSLKEPDNAWTQPQTAVPGETVHNACPTTTLLFKFGEQVGRLPPTRIQIGGHAWEHATMGDA
ncbi:hypothetical protein NMY22_g10598 [Coprinellus aureogranulatus]|nr:hypothetical protein NMY22_g10598 [Coprinellus aureogranulatus]